MEAGKLYICPTPIGNLEDITIRCLNVLKEVDLIAAEDTRRTIKLLNHFDIKNPLTSYHEHNKREKGPKLIGDILEGKNIALVSDAGMPGISDPGTDIIKLAIEEDIGIDVLPGATASITALVLSGLDTDKFIFEGFLSSKDKERKEELEKIKGNQETTIIYESPYRMKRILKDMKDIFPDRKISISRELTKKYEETLRGTVGEMQKLFLEKDIKGEFVIVLEGEVGKEDQEEELDLEKLLKDYMDMGYTKSRAVKKVSQDFEIPRNLVYKVSIKL